MCSLLISEASKRKEEMSYEEGNLEIDIAVDSKYIDGDWNDPRSDFLYGVLTKKVILIFEDHLNLLHLIIPLPFLFRDASDMLCPQLTRQLRRNVFFCHLILKATLLLYAL